MTSILLIASGTAARLRTDPRSSTSDGRLPDPRRRPSTRILVLGIVCLALPIGSAGASSFTGLGDLPGGSFRSVAHGVSADGSVIVGESESVADGTTEAFVWSGAMTGLGDLPGGIFQSIAHGVSADGSVIVGEGDSGNGTEAFVWSGSMTGLGHLIPGGSRSVAHGVSADGSVIVGESESVFGMEAFVWSGGMTGLGDLPGGSFRSVAHGVSADGSAIVGESESANGTEAFVWDGGMTGLGDLPGGSFRSVAHGVSADGSVIVGESESANGTEAFVWSGGMTGLGDLPGGIFESIAYAASADGSRIVGESSSDRGPEAFLWDAGHGMRSLQDVLETAPGVELAGWTLIRATAISDDGSVVVGVGINPSGDPEAWRAVLEPSPTPTRTATLTPTATPTRTPTPTRTATPTIAHLHAGDLDGWSDRGLLSWRARVNIAVHNAAHGPVAGATVGGSWSIGGSSSCVTGSNGRCAVSSSSMLILRPSVKFTVTASGGSFSAAANHDPDRDSNGTTIEVRR